MAGIFGADRFSLNTFHRKAIVAVSDGVVETARATDGVVEAIEVPHYAFAMGLQWHPERLDFANHPGASIFGAFVAAAIASSSAAEPSASAPLVRSADRRPAT